MCTLKKRCFPLSRCLPEELIELWWVDCYPKSWECPQTSPGLNSVPSSLRHNNLCWTFSAERRGEKLEWFSVTQPQNKKKKKNQSPFGLFNLSLKDLKRSDRVLCLETDAMLWEMKLSLKNLTSFKGEYALPAWWSSKYLNLGSLQSGRNTALETTMEKKKKKSK